jgi:hypothetical protein
MLNFDLCLNKKVKCMKKVLGLGLVLSMLLVGNSFAGKCNTLCRDMTCTKDNGYACTKDGNATNYGKYFCIDSDAGISVYESVNDCKRTRCHCGA